MSVENFLNLPSNQEAKDVLIDAKEINEWPSKLTKNQQVVFSGFDVTRRAYGSELVEVKRRSIFDHLQDEINKNQVVGSFYMIKKGQIKPRQFVHHLGKGPTLND